MVFQQHMKVLKHFLYIQYGSGPQSVVVYSLNKDITAAFGIRHTHISFVTQPDFDMWCGDLTLTCVTAQGCTQMHSHTI